MSMPALVLHFLGPPKIEVAGAPLTLTRRKAVALLAYLALADGPQPRDSAATLLWPGYGQSDARGNLRRTLYALRSAVGADYLHATHSDLVLAGPDLVWTDVQAFLDAVTAPGRAVRGETANKTDALAAALQLYRGDFLAGFSLGDSPEFDAWQLRQADLLQLLFLDASDSLVAQLREQDTLQDAIAAARRALAIAPGREKTHRLLMELFARDGRRLDALRQYERCRELLQAELALEPDAQTEQLYERIRRGDFAPRRELADMAFTRPRARYNIPALPTTFVPRDKELGEIVTRLRDPACRLLTLVGPGGMGKTFLATQAARQFADDEMLFPDGVFWVDLAGFSTPDAVAPAVADAVGARLHRDAPEIEQLTGYLAGKALLIVLDNFEHLVDAASSLSLILTRAARCKLLITSRVTLQLQGEWLYAVSGMEYPPAAEAVLATREKDLVDYGAVQLFTQAARRRLNRFEPEAHAAAIVRICRAVDGMPLALEMAAVWLRSMSCEEVATRLVDHAEMLASRRRDVSRRQVSIQAIFDHSWRALTAGQQQALARLSVLRGHFGWPAATAVAGVSPLDLEALIDHSFVQRMQAKNSYTIHELLRQFAAQKLAAAPDVAAATHQVHAEHYAQYLVEQQQAMTGSEQAAALDAISGRSDNIRAAWRWAAQNRRLSILATMLRPLFDFYTIRSKFQEGEQAAEEALAALSAEQADARLLAQLHNRVALCQHYLQKWEASDQHLTEALTLAQAHGMSQEEALAQRVMGMNALARDDYAGAERSLSAALQQYQTIGDSEGEATVWYELGIVMTMQSRLREAVPRFEQSLVISRRLERTDWIAYSLDMLAWHRFNLGELERAAQDFDEALRLFQIIDDRRGIAKTIGGADRARLYLGTGTVQAVVDAGELALELFESVGEELEVVGRLEILSTTVLYYDQDVEAARRYIDRALAITSQWPTSSVRSRCFSQSALVAVFEDAPARARRDLRHAIALCEISNDAQRAEIVLISVAYLLAAGYSLAPERAASPIECQMEAVRLLSMLQTSMVSYQWISYRGWTDRCLAQLAAGLPESTFAATVREGKDLRVGDVLADLAAGLPALPDPSPSNPAE